MNTLAQLKNNAEAAHSQYLQYRGHWDKWVLGKITKDIKGKGGRVMFTKGEYVMVNPSTLNYAIEDGPKQGKISPTCYSNAINCDASLGGPFVAIVLGL